MEEPSPKKSKLDDDALLLDQLRVEAQSWCGANGLVMVAANRMDGSWQHAPVALLPASMPREFFQRALDLAKPFNHLVDRVSRDGKFLEDTLEETIKGDDFTRRLVELFRKHGGDKARQKICLGIHRSDYMIDTETNRLLQIELNTIASSFACLSARVTRLHRHILLQNSHLLHIASELDARFSKDSKQLDKSLPQNPADRELPKGIAKAHQVYAEKRPDTSRELFVVFIVQDGERNYVDQRHLEYELSSVHNVPVLRMSLAQVLASAEVLEPSGALIINGNKEVSVVYFRAGYTPVDYPSENEWKARELIESSLAIKCPSIAYHLVGAKKVQQRLADPGILEKFVTDHDEREKLRSCFAGLWSLGRDLDPKVHEQAIANPSKFVLKPQREGGGNNIYGEQVREALKKMTKEELAAHILMERIFPPREATFFMRDGSVQKGPALSELGIYSTFIGDGSIVYTDELAGHLLRTKFDGIDEGGVATGYSALNSLLLV